MTYAIRTQKLRLFGPWRGHLDPCRRQLRLAAYPGKCTLHLLHQEPHSRAEAPCLERQQN